MRLLVSVAGAADASAALAGGADLVDAKDPASGALGAVPIAALLEIARAVGGARPLTAAIGDAADERSIALAAARGAASGAAFVKVGLAGIGDRARGAALVAAALQGAREGSAGRCGLVVAAYADSSPPCCLPPLVVMDVAARAGAHGILLDTVNKSGPALRALMTAGALADWVRRAHEARLVAALAGGLRAGDLPAIREAGADIAGVRGAACAGGRAGTVSEDRVRRLASLCAVRAAEARFGNALSA